MILSSHNQQVTQVWANSISTTQTTENTRSKLPDAPAHSRQTWFHYKSQPSWSSQMLHHVHTVRITGFEDCNHLISSLQQQTPESLSSAFMNHEAVPFTCSRCDFRLPFKPAFFCKSLPSNSPTELCYWYQDQISSAAESMLLPYACLCFFRIVLRNISTFCASQLTVVVQRTKKYLKHSRTGTNQTKCTSE